MAAPPEVSSETTQVMNTVPPASPQVAANFSSLPVGWIPLENRIYRRLSVYKSLKWSLTSQDLRTSLIAAAPCAGPVAVIPDHGWGLAYALAVYTASGILLSRFDTVRASESSRAPVRVIALGWTRGDSIVLVYEDAYVVRIAFSKTPASVISKPVLAVTEDARPDLIHDALVLFEGQTVLRGANGILFCMAEDNAPRRFPGTFPPPRVPTQLPLSASGHDENVLRNNHCCLVASSTLSGSRRVADVEIAVIFENGSLSTVNANGEVPVPSKDIHKAVVLSPDGKYMATFVAPAFVVVRNLSSLTEIVRAAVPEAILSESRTNRDPDMIAWVGSDAVALVYGSSMLLFGPHGNSASVALDAKPDFGFFLSTEKDGLQVVSESSLEFVQLVPEAIEAVGLRDNSPPYKLYRAAAGGTWNISQAQADSLERNNELDVDTGKFHGEKFSPLKRYAALTELKDASLLGVAAQGCIDAACVSWDVVEQKELLAAATYGHRLRLIMNGSDAAATPSTLDLGSATVSQARRLLSRREELTVPMAVSVIRLLNACRAAEAGVPLTKPQLDSLGLQGLVNRFSKFAKHDLSLRICAFCGVQPNGALAAWARECISGDEKDETIAEKIIRHFENTGRSFEPRDGEQRIALLPFVPAAEAAYAAGRVICAEILLDKELYPALKVPLFLKMGKESLALNSAIDSNDNEILMDAVQHLLHERSIREMVTLFNTLAGSKPHRVTDLLVTHLRQMGDSENARVLLTEAGRHREAALELISEANKISDPKARLSALEKATQFISRGSQRRALAFEIYAAQHAITAAYDAIDLEKKCDMETGNLRGASSTKLLSVAAGIRDPSRRRDALTRLRRDLKIPEQRFFWVVLEALAGANDLGAVEALSNSAGHGRPPPIGLMAFVDVCLRYGQEDEATKYALRIADLRDRARALARCGRGKEAADIAAKLRSDQLLSEVEALVARHMSQIHLSTSGSDNRD